MCDSLPQTDLNLLNSFYVIAFIVGQWYIYLQRKGLIQCCNVGELN